MYSQNVPEGGPIATSISINEDKEKFQLIGKPSEDQGHAEFDNVFNMKIKFFEEKASFKQKIRLLTSDKIKIEGTLEFMVCDDTFCLPPTEVDISFEEVQGMAGEAVTAACQAKHRTRVSCKVLKTVEKTNEADTTQIVGKTKQEKKKSLWTLFILSFFAGFAALLTPCVFPMIPMTVSFFTKQSKTKAIGIRNAILFGVSIVFLYVLLGTVVTSIFGADSLMLYQPMSGSILYFSYY